MRPVCCICTGRHHPLSCPVALRTLDQCADPTPDDYTPTQGAPLAAVIDLPSHRRCSDLDPATAAQRRVERHRSAARRRWRA